MGLASDKRSEEILGLLLVLAAAVAIGLSVWIGYFTDWPKAFREWVGLAPLGVVVVALVPAWIASSVGQSVK